ncbi:Protein of unknown function [Clostridium collagenovorans DSM 3089]|uniref:DUF1667 domain-containing protein n=1 Tax=Clostridium collagenovorans DSM 3089 TaxID=1121306 RepID=A0A1M5YKA4_9CLOT|nr:DUF1667 domain-containing protein [Clostridium collagenovorans]SHI12420.1 Protein of unknown function [Clostridium collagenovorans DSM 3089]
MSSNKEIFTTIIHIKGSKEFNVVPVRTSEPVDKDLWKELSKALSRLRVGPPLKIGDVVCQNILNTGIDVLCSKNIKK